MCVRACGCFGYASVVRVRECCECWVGYMRVRCACVYESVGVCECSVCVSGKRAYDCACP